MWGCLPYPFSYLFEVSPFRDCGIWTGKPTNKKGGAALLGRGFFFFFFARNIPAAKWNTGTPVQADQAQWPEPGQSLPSPGKFFYHLKPFFFLENLGFPSPLWGRNIRENTLELGFAGAAGLVSLWRNSSLNPLCPIRNSLVR